MLLRSYYHLKPFIPRRLQIAIRRFLVRNRRAKNLHVWPIDQKAARAPNGWGGWPYHKPFAFVLTHDVEGPRGYERCLAIAELEKCYGFRSSFNFVAEDYHVSQEMRRKLVDDGFEVGLHGLSHDGHLYRSRKDFLAQAARINRILKEWGIVGFRSPAMHRNFEWIADLDIAYDASTFDTDPFEPYPEGVGTIFPFIVDIVPSRPSYVELPYTLPQDFSIFVLLGESTTDIWRQKLDWIVEHGGMALLITHPDYVAFKDKAPSTDEYHISLYEDFLRYVKENYRDNYWNALPREVAHFWKTSFLLPQSTGEDG